MNETLDLNFISCVVFFSSVSYFMVFFKKVFIVFWRLLETIDILVKTA